MQIFDIINVPLGYLLKFCYTILPNYALALLLFAIVIKAVLFPLGIKQQKNMVKQAQLKPKDAAIRKKYAGRNDKATQQKMNEEIMKLYQQENFNPMGGCLPLLIELPVIFALFNVINKPLKYICNLSEEVIAAITARVTELAETVDQIGTIVADASRGMTEIQMINIMKLDFSNFTDIFQTHGVDFSIKSLPDFTVFGGAMDLSQNPSFSPPTLLLIIPVLVFVSYFFSTKITKKFTYTPEQTGDAGMSMKIMEFTMPLISVWISFSMPAIIGLYWIYQSMIQVARQFILFKLYPYPKFTEEDFKKAEREMSGKLTKSERRKIKEGTGVRSLHRIDDEEDSEDEEDDDSPPRLVESNQKDDEGLIKKAALKDESDKNKSDKSDKSEESDEEE